MVKFRKLVVPVDFSDYSRATLKYAVDLAGTDAEIVIIHVLVPDLPKNELLSQAGPINPLPEVVELARQDLANIESLVSGVKCRSLLRIGEPGPEIVACAQEEAADVIVMSTKGRSGLARLLMGSTTESVVRHSTVPVLTVRAATLA